MRPAARARLSIAALLFFGTAGLAACGGKEPAPPAATAQAAALATIEVGAATAPAELLLDGIVEAVNQATLSAQTAGRVAEVKVEVNDRVRAGDLLLRLRATEQVAGLGQAQARLNAAQAQEAQARAQHDRIRDMYERKVVATCNLRCRGRGPRFRRGGSCGGACRCRVGPRRRRLHRTARAV